MGFTSTFTLIFYSNLISENETKLFDRNQALSLYAIGLQSLMVSPHMLACCHNGTAWRTATHHSRVLAPLTSSPPKLFLTIRSYIFLSYIFLAFLCAGDTNIQLIILVGFVKLFCCTLLNLLLASRVCTPISVYLYVWCGVFHVALLSSQSNRSTAAFLCEVSALESLLANTSQELVKSRIDVSSVLR